MIVSQYKSGHVSNRTILENVLLKILSGRTHEYVEDEYLKVSHKFNEGTLSDRVKNKNKNIKDEKTKTLK